MKKFVRQVLACHLLFILFTGRRLFFYFVFFSITYSSWSQVLFTENFDRANSTTVGNGWTELENGTSGAQIVSNRLQLGGVALSGREFVLRDANGLYTTNGLTNNTGQLEWAFNFRTTRTDPSGFSSGGYGIGFILAKSTADITGGVGYAVILGSSNSPDPIRLVRFASGIDANTDFTDIISSGAYSGNEYLSIRVVYNAVTDEWSLFAEGNASSFPQMNPANTTTQVGLTTVNTTYTTGNDLRYLGAYWNHGTVSTQNAVFDDISVTALPVSYYPRTSATDLSQASQWTTDPAGIAGTSPTNFTSLNQTFNLNNNVAAPMVSNSWMLSGGSNLVLNNSASLIINPTAGLIIGTGSKADFNGKSITLKSSATATAFIGNTTGIITNATNVTVERYISSLNNRAYRLLSPSVSTTTSIYNNWQEAGSTAAGYGTHITGSTTGANGFDATQTGNPSLYLYNSITPSWEAISNTNVTTLSALAGYLTLIRGDRAVDLNSTATPPPTSNTTLRATGSLLTGTQTFTPAATGFTLITNPYASPIDWASIKAASTGIESYYTFWDPNVGVRGGYVTVNTSGTKSPATSAGGAIIPSGIAFFVKAASAGTPNVEIREAHKTTTQPADVFRTGTQTETFSASLFYTNASNQRITADGIVTVYSNDYSVDYDEADATQIPNWDEDVAIGRGGRSLSIESRPLIDKRDTIYLTVSRLKVQAYEWQFDASDFNYPGLQAVLVDHFLNITTPLSLTGQTVVPFTVTGNSASAAADRFSVIFVNPIALPIRLTQISAQQKGKDVLVKWTSASDAEVREYVIEKSVDGRTFTNASVSASRSTAGAAVYQWLDVQTITGKNYYRIKAIGRNGEVNYSAIVSVDLSGKASPVTLYPNPIQGNDVGINLNLSAGTYTLRLINVAGQTVHQQQVVHASGTASQTITLSQEVVPGVYQLIISSEKSSYTQRLIKH